MADRPRQVVDVVEGRDIPLPLPGQDRLAARLIRPRPQARVMQPHDRLQVVGGVQRLLQGPGRNPRKRLAVGRLGAVVLDEGVGLAVGRRPLGLVGVEGALTPDEGGLGGQGHQLRRGRPPVVEHALGVPGVAHQAAQAPPAVDPDLLAIDRDQGDVAPRPVHRLQHGRPRQDPLHHPQARRLAGRTNRRQARSLQEGPARLEHLRLHLLAVVERHQAPLHRLAPPGLEDPHPASAVTAKARHLARHIVLHRPVHRLGVRPAGPEGCQAHLPGHEGHVPVRGVRRQGVRVAPDAEGVGHPLDGQVQVLASRL